MRNIWFCSLAVVMLTLSGCTEMRVEGDAKVFQSSAMGSLIRTIIGIALIGLGGVAIAGGILPDKKPKKRTAKPTEKLSSGQRARFVVFGGAMGFAGLFLACASLFFPSKLHVSVYPDRVAMASNYSQTGGREVVIPFADLTSVELRDELNIVGKLTTYLVFTLKNGSVVRQDAGNNERKAVDTIQQALADFAGVAPAAVNENPVVASSMPDSSSASIEQPIATPPATEPAPSFTFPTPPPTGFASDAAAPPSSAAATDTTGGSPASTSEKYSLKRYEITIPVSAGHMIVGPDTIVEVGRKLKACYAGSWSTVTVVAVNNDGTITCNWDSYPSYTYKMMREDLTIGNLDGTTSPSEVPSKQYSLKRYKISIPVPSGFAIVDADADVKVGTKLGACYAGRWEPVTVVAINDDGTITCNWDNYPAFTYKMMREDLTMAK